jgi:hypothetical protein
MIHLRPHTMKIHNTILDQSRLRIDLAHVEKEFLDISLTKYALLLYAINSPFYTSRF